MRRDASSGTRRARAAGYPQIDPPARPTHDGFALAFHSFTHVQLSSCDTVSLMPPRLTAPHPLPDQLVELIAQRFRVLGEPVRIKLLDHLREDSATVSELQQATGASQQNVSKHLSILLGAGIVTRTKEGTASRYAIADEGVFELCEQVCGGLRQQVDQLEALLQGRVAG